MTYDQWKTTDPRDYEPEQEEGPSELELVYGQLHKAQKALQSIADNTCCEGCQEAALVARAALASLSEGK